MLAKQNRISKFYDRTPLPYGIVDGTYRTEELPEASHLGQQWAETTSELACARDTIDELEQRLSVQQQLIEARDNEIRAATEATMKEAAVKDGSPNEPGRRIRAAIGIILSAAAMFAAALLERWSGQ